VDADAGWNQHFVSYNPSPSWWKEESSGGYDNSYADYTELSLTLAHSVSYGGHIVAGFGGQTYALPSTIRLGYASPDAYGYCIWWFALECSLLNDTDYTSWYDSMTGIHMILGFVNDASVTNIDMTELANRLNGTGGFNRTTIKDSFFYTFVDWDGIHNDNVARIIGENSQVLDNDYLNSFSSQVSVDASKYVVSCYY
jgi:hypothetical protein